MKAVFEFIKSSISRCKRDSCKRKSEYVLESPCKKFKMQSEYQVVKNNLEDCNEGQSQQQDNFVDLLIFGQSIQKQVQDTENKNLKTQHTDLQENINGLKEQFINHREDLQKPQSKFVDMEIQTSKERCKRQFVEQAVQTSQQNSAVRVERQVQACTQTIEVTEASQNQLVVNLISQEQMICEIQQEPILVTTQNRPDISYNDLIKQQLESSKLKQDKSGRISQKDILSEGDLQEKVEKNDQASQQLIMKSVQEGKSVQALSQKTQRTKSQQKNSSCYVSKEKQGAQAEKEIIWSDQKNIQAEKTEQSEAPPQYLFQQEIPLVQNQNKPQITLKFKPLTQELIKKYKQIVSEIKSKDISQKLENGITYKDLSLLVPQTDINDNIINTYLKIFSNAQNEIPSFQRIHIFNTYFYSTIEQQAPSNRYQKAQRILNKAKVKLCEKALLIFPINVENKHWYLIAVDNAASLESSSFLQADIIQEIIKAEYQENNPTNK